MNRVNQLKRMMLTRFFVATLVFALQVCSAAFTSVASQESGVLLDQDFCNKAKELMIRNPLGQKRNEYIAGLSTDHSQSSVQNDPASRTLVTETIFGRNLALVKNPEKVVIIVTGTGPRYGVDAKIKLNQIFGCPVLDVFDIMPLENSVRLFCDKMNIEKEKTVEAKDLLRDTIHLFRNLSKLSEANTNIQKSLRSKKQSGMSSKLATDLALFMENIREILERNPSIVDVLAEGAISVEEMLPEVSTVLDSVNNYVRAASNSQQEIKSKKSEAESAVSRFIENHISALSGRLTDIVQGIVSNFLDDIEVLAVKYKESLPTMSSGSVQALADLKKLLLPDVVERLCNLTTSTISSDTGTFEDKQIAKGKRECLGHLLHSEVLAIEWVSQNAQGNSIPFVLFTQRGMCETCNPAVRLYCKRLGCTGVRPILIYSIPARRPGRTYNLAPDLQVSWASSFDSSQGAADCINVWMADGFDVPTVESLVPENEVLQGFYRDEVNVMTSIERSSE